jgi:PST family polysaccharide transporter
MSLRRAASLGAVQSGAAMATGFLSIKITSVYLGPAGLGTLGQLQYFIAIALGVFMSGLNTGVIRRTAELGATTSRHSLLVSTVLRLVVLIGVPVSIVIAWSSGWLARELLHDELLRTPLLLFAAVYVFGLVGSLIVGCANGAKDYKATAILNISSSLGSLALMALLAPAFGVLGAMLAAALIPGVTFVFAWVLARRHAWWPHRPMGNGFSGHEAKSAAAFIPAAAVSAIAGPLIQILARDHLASHSGMASVGLLQGVMRLSDMYMGIATSVLAMYFLPRFSEIQLAGELRRELGKGLLLVFPAVAVASLAIYLLRDPIVHLVFTSEFLPMRDLFAWQMTGNVLKLIGWMFAYVLIAKAYPPLFAAFELISVLVWWQLAISFIDVNGAVGATQAFAVTYAIYALAGLVGIVVVLRNMGNKTNETPDES